MTCLRARKRRYKIPNEEEKGGISHIPFFIVFPFYVFSGPVKKTNCFFGLATRNIYLENGTKLNQAFLFFLLFEIVQNVKANTALDLMEGGRTEKSLCAYNMGRSPNAG